MFVLQPTRHGAQKSIEHPMLSYLIPRCTEMGDIGRIVNNIVYTNYVLCVQSVYQCCYSAQCCWSCTRRSWWLKMKWRGWKEKEGTCLTELSLSSAPNLQKWWTELLVCCTNVDTTRKQGSWEVGEVVRLLNNELSVTAEPVHPIPALTVVCGLT